MDLKDLKKLRIKKGVSQMDMARELKFSLNSYSLWERGGGKPNEENLAKLKTFFGIKENN